MMPRFTMAANVTKDEKVYKISKVYKVYKVYKVSKVYKAYKVYKVFEVSEVSKVSKVFEVSKVSKVYKVSTGCKRLIRFSRIFRSLGNVRSFSRFCAKYFTLESSLSSFESMFSLSVFLTSIIRRSSASNSWPT